MTCDPRKAACGLATEMRREMVLRTHPLHNHKDEQPAPCLLGVDQALAIDLELKEDLEMRLAVVNRDIALLRDEVAA